MLNNFLARPNNFPLRRFWWKNWYNLFTGYYSDIDIFLMNYGYDDGDKSKQIALSERDEKERYCIQLYHHVASAVDFQGLDVLEIGCGRGGGASYLKRYLNPRSVTGIDFSQSNINFCNQNHDISGLSFSLGDAESLTLKDSSFDVVINIESSHCYQKMEKFFSEVYRVLSPNGYFLFADFRPSEDIKKTQEKLQKTGFNILKEEIITANILASIDLENRRKVAIIEAKIPRFFRGIAYWFTVTKGTPIYEAFKQREMEYLYYVLQK